MAVKRRRVIVNFKETQEDIKLFDDLKKHSSISGYIKDVLRGVIKIDNIPETTIKTNSTNNENIDIDDILGGI